MTLATLPHINAQPLVYLYLSQIPYTGLELGPVGTTVYWIALLGWSVALAYLTLFVIVPFLRRSARSLGERVSALLNAQQEAIRQASVASSPTPAIAHVELPEKPVQLPSAHYSSYEGFKSFAHNGALSIDDIVKGLSRQRVAEPTVAPLPVSPHVEPIYEKVEPIAVTASSNEELPVSADARSLASALVQGDRAAVFAGLRQQVRMGGAPDALISSIACLLDDTYRARIDGTPSDAAIARLTARLDTPTLEKLLAALTTAIDSSYTDKVTGAKLALTRALAVLGA